MPPRPSMHRPAETPRLTVASLSRRSPHDFRLSPDPSDRAELAQALGLLALRKLSFAGALIPRGRHDWELDGMLGATVVQPCVVSGAPVTTRIDTPVARHFLADLTEPEGAEIESPEDDSREALGSVIDLAGVMTEALSLALPDYPRAPDLPPAPDAPPESDEDEARPNPFAALAALKPRSGEKDEG